MTKAGKRLDAILIETLYWVKERKEADKVMIICDEEVPKKLVEFLEKQQVPYNIVPSEKFKMEEGIYSIDLTRIELTEQGDPSYLRHYPQLYSELIKKYNLAETNF